MSNTWTVKRESPAPVPPLEMFAMTERTPISVGPFKLTLHRFAGFKLAIAWWGAHVIKSFVYERDQPSRTGAGRWSW